MSRFVLSLLTIMLTDLPADAEVQRINVDFNDATSPTFSGPAATGEPGDVWNGLNLIDDVNVWTSPLLLDAAGSQTSATVSVDLQQRGWKFNTVDTSNVPADAIDLIRDYLFINAEDPDCNGGQGGCGVDVTISGLPKDADYELVLYGVGAGFFQNALFDVEGSNEEEQFTLSTVRTPLFSPQHYVTFTGNTGPDGELLILWSHDLSSDRQEGFDTFTPFAALNGFQLVTTEPGVTSPIPEPSSWALVACLGLAFAAGRQRQSTPARTSAA